MIEERALLDAVNNLQKEFEVFKAEISKDNEFLRQLLINYQLQTDKHEEAIEELKIRLAEQDASYQTTLRNRSLIGGLVLGFIGLLELGMIAWNLLLK